jgi:hypothetical protein
MTMCEGTGRFPPPPESDRMVRPFWYGVGSNFGQYRGEGGEEDSGLVEK